mgnify:CR=1 FL=1
MIGVGSIIGGAMKLGAGIFGGISAARAARKMKENIEQQREKDAEMLAQMAE